MRTAVWGFLGVACLLLVGIGVAGGRDFAYGQATAGHRSAVPTSMIALTAQGPEGVQQVTVIDTTMRVMSVYHVDQTTGRISLKSVRNVHWDLQMEEFNGQSPSPREIQSLLRSRP